MKKISLKEIRYSRPLRRLALFLAVAIVFSTTYALILPALTLADEPLCGMEVHKHTEECYAPEKGLICGEEEYKEHKHTEECYTTEKGYVCGLEEGEGHTHTADCYATVDELVCTLEEGDDHVHGKDCWVQREVLVCGKTEAPAHVHSDECLGEVETLVCGMKEGPGHVHTDACYAEVSVLICKLPEHEHDESCFVEREEEPEEEELVLTEQFLSQKVNGHEIRVSGLMPEGSTLQVVTLPQDAAEKLYGMYAGETGEEDVCAFDVSIIAPDGTKYCPEEHGVSLSVTITNLDKETAEILHIPEDVTEDGKLSTDALDDVIKRMDEGGIQSEDVNTVPVEDGLSFNMSSFSILITAQPKSGGGQKGGGGNRNSSISIQGDNNFTLPTGSEPVEYDLKNDTNNTIQVSYTPDATMGTQNTVLVITAPSYGMKFTSDSIPLAGVNGIKSNGVIYDQDNSPWRVIIALEDNLTDECTYSMHLETIGLSQAQAIEWMDSADGKLPVSYYSAQEYTCAGDPANVLTEGTLGGHAESAPMRPQSYTAVHLEPTATTSSNDYNYLHTFHYSTSAKGNLANVYLGTAGYGIGDNYQVIYPYLSGGLRWSIPTVHFSSESLIEIRKIRIYVPHENLELVSTSNGSYYIGNLDQGWATAGPISTTPTVSWTLGQRQFDSAQNAYYYELTPNQRWFNRGLGNFGDLNSCFYGMNLKFQMINDPQTGLPTDLPYSSSDDIDLIAKDTVITYWVPGDGHTNHTYTQQGPHINVYQRLDSYTDTVFPYERYENNPTQSQLNVVVGETIPSSVASYFNNQYYLKRAVLSGTGAIGQQGLSSGSTPTKEHQLIYKGAVTQSYEFNYAVQPQDIQLKEGGARHRGYDYGEELAYIKYWLFDDETAYSVPSSQISAANTAFAADSSSVVSRTLTFPNATSAHPVRKVEVKWNKLYVDWHYGVGYGTPAYQNLLQNHDIYGCSVMTTSFKYVVTGQKHADDGTVSEFCSTNGYQIYDKVQAVYDVTYDGANAPTGQTYPEGYLWYRLIQPPCPFLVGYNEDTPTGKGNPFWLDDRTSTIGSVAVWVGNDGEGDSEGEYADYVLRPEIMLDMRLYLSGAENNTGTNFYAPNSPTYNTLVNFADSKAWSFFTGRFTAMPRLSGWTVTYKTRTGVGGAEVTGTYTIPQITNPNGQSVLIHELAEGEYFTAVSLRYDPPGEENDYVDFSHDHNTVGSKGIYLIKDFEIRHISTDPWTGEKIRFSSSNPYHAFFVVLGGYMHNDNCRCPDHMHTPTGRDAQKMSAYISYDYYVNAKRVLTYPSRLFFINRQNQIVFSDVWDSDPTSANSHAESHDDQVTQGGQALFRIHPKLNLTPMRDQAISFHYDYEHQNSPTTTSFNGTMYWPFDIRFAVYVELTDTANFSVDYSRINFYGETVGGGNLLADEITAGGKTFLRLRLREGYVLPGRNYISNTSTEDGGYFLEDGTMITANNPLARMYFGRPIEIGLTAHPDAQVGDRYPLGEVYFDYSELLDKYDAPNATGYDHDMTNYTFSSNAVADTYGLHQHTGSTTEHTAAETKRLFKTSFAEGSDHPYKVEVTVAAVAGSHVYPGKQEHYEYSTLMQSFYPHERQLLNAIVNITGATTQYVYDYSTYVTLPGSGVTINYTENGQPTSVTGNLSLKLRGPATIETDNVVDLPAPDDPHVVTITYTTDANPGPSSAYVAASAVGDWSAVTGLKIHTNYMSGGNVFGNGVDTGSSINLRLDLEADPKEMAAETTADPNDSPFTEFQAWAGGSYQYRVGSPQATLTDVAWMPPAEWVYLNYTVSGSVFWDVYDENGVRSSLLSNNSYTFRPTENQIQGLTVKLYKPGSVSSANLIASTTTVAGNNNISYTPNFTLQTYLPDAGQILRISFPNGGGATVVLTAKSGQGYSASGIDSDFARKNSSNAFVSSWARLNLDALTEEGAQNISAGFVKLPSLTAQDVMLIAGDHANATATMTEYLRSALPADSYNITFHGLDDGVARVTETTVVLTAADTNAQPQSFTAAPYHIVEGIASGVTTAYVSVTNRLGDTITVPYTITVAVPALTITKQVVGVTGYVGSFDFTVSFKDADGQPFIVPTPGGSPAPYAVDANGVVTFSLSDGESVSIEGVPLGGTASFAEAASDGFNVLIKENGTVTLAAGNSYEDYAISGEHNILFVNVAGQALPNAGGEGRAPYTVAGLAMMTLALGALLVLNRRKKENRA